MGIQPGQCVNLTRKVNINLCKSGATMSMKYEAHMPDVEGETYCYGYKFLKVRKQWLPEGPCSVTTNIACKMDGGDKANQDCSGNIVKSTNPNNCESVPVKWQYTYCFWNIGENQVFDFTPQGKTWAKIKGNKISALDQTPLDSNVKCRFRQESSTIDTCDDRTGSSIQVAGRYQLSADKEETCTSLSSLKVYAAATCQYNFIITEIIDPVNKPTHRYIEIYTPSCAGQVIIDDLWIVKYRRDKTNPSYVNPINLKGLEIPDDGFMVFLPHRKVMPFIMVLVILSLKMVQPQIVMDVIISVSSVERLIRTLKYSTFLVRLVKMGKVAIITFRMVVPFESQLRQLQQMSGIQMIGLLLYQLVIQMLIRTYGLVRQRHPLRARRKQTLKARRWHPLKAQQRHPRVLPLC